MVQLIRDTLVINVWWSEERALMGLHSNKPAIWWKVHTTRTCRLHRDITVGVLWIMMSCIFKEKHSSFISKVNNANEVSIERNKSHKKLNYGGYHTVFCSGLAYKELCGTGT